MQKYIAHPETEVHGQAMLHFFVSINREEFLPAVEDILAENGVGKIEEDQWYPMQLWLDIFQRIAENSNSMSNLVALGMSAIETGTLPPDIDSIVSAMNLLNAIYGLNLRNFPDDEGYEVSEVGKRHVRVKDRTPFPHDVVYGYIYGLSKQFGNAETFTVRRTYLNEADPDSDGAVYDITW
ncbi:MAG: hypothetical protein GYB65_03560 [Chloroflexi bacterium]|nr:hypothetical protein [Chloroflexota bacterium]